MNSHVPLHRRAFQPVRTAAQIVWRTVSKAWEDSILSLAATAAFWQVLSLPPLLLGMLGAVGYVGDWFGPDTVDIIESRLISFSGQVFTENVVDQIIQPMVSDVLAQGRLQLVSVGFLISLWAGSAAIAAFVDGIVKAHDQSDHRHPVWQRFFALFLYVGFLVLAVFTLPLVALGPTLIMELIPDFWNGVASDLVRLLYYPAVGLLLIFGLTLLYKVALPKTLPWRRLMYGAIVAGLVFYGASAGLRIYLSTVTRTGYTYGALATPIAFLLFAFFLGFAIVIGAEFNATIQQHWPARATRLEQMKSWLGQQVKDTGEQAEDKPVATQLFHLATRKIRVATNRTKDGTVQQVELDSPADHDEPDGDQQSCPVDAPHGHSVDRGDEPQDRMRS
ncbi:YihY/virulence factor BrkB family protein [Hoyosella rhizosphaerae]|uniref:Ribonuclease BN n=1 Tax=Hoyosella rhizosphaerae TaxID=1755582 RepID=A0A916U5I8_9ACTN|nr:YihY/virulence factor BrkB family protein [Hoyosella rhizosphaerae]MBN4926377.1 YihY/virulence factor BrkB family protein [Hoyosella rhizosphaerae]GGC59864.1 putative ribonuclease BN [Hoyosella rhizosphaerae]